jgi:membrane protein YdbS with pleckstrin-like domain
MANPPRVFKVQTHATARYFRSSVCLACLLGGVWLFGAGLVVAAVYWIWGKSLSTRQSQALSYRLENGKLCADSGVYFLKRKSIPLDRVSDFMLAQGPLQRRYGIWALHVQTAGAGGQTIAEAILFGLEDPEAVRDELFGVVTVPTPKTSTSSVSPMLRPLNSP